MPWSDCAPMAIHFNPAQKAPASSAQLAPAGMPPLGATQRVRGLPYRRLAVLCFLLAARTLRRVMAGIRRCYGRLSCRRLLLCPGWLLGRVRHGWLVGLEHSWFPARRWHLVVGALLGLKGLQMGWWVLRWLFSTPSRRRLEEKLRGAQSYSEWLAVAMELESAPGGRKCQPGKSELPDRAALLARSARLRALRARGDVAGVMHVLRVDLARHAGHVKDGDGDDPCPLELLRPLQEFTEETRLSLAYLENCPDVSTDEKLTFLRELRHAFGRSALLLSGGGSFGFFHNGVWKALFEANVLPRVMSGSSAGAIAAAMLCTKTDAELEEAARIYPAAWDYRFFAHDTQLRQWKHLLLNGTLQDAVVFQQVLHNIFGDLTFTEAYQRTGRVLNISVTPFDTREPHRLLNYLTAPNVLVRSAVAASSAFPWLFNPTDLLAKTSGGEVVRFTPEGCTQLRRWCDGSIQADLPMQGLREMFSCNFFVVSQCNPYLLPLVGFKRWLPRMLAVLWETEFKHRCRQLLHFFPTSHMLSLLSQPWEGDVSMVLPATTFPFKRAAANLTQKELRRAMQEGQLATWAKLSAIQSSTAIELAIDERLQHMTAQAAARQQQLLVKARLLAVVGDRTMRRSLPSWLHMPALGLPISTSKEDLPISAASSAADLLHVLAPAGPPPLAGPAAPVVGTHGTQPAEEEGEGREAEAVAVVVEGEVAGHPWLSQWEGDQPGAGRGVDAGPAVWLDLVLLGSVSAGADALDVIAP